LKEFVDKKASEFSNFNIQYQQGARPVIELKDESGSVVDSVGIDQWKTEHIVDFLREKLA